MLFTILKARKLVFANPLARIRTWPANQAQPLPLENLDGLRGALDSPIPGLFGLSIGTASRYTDAVRELASDE